MKSQFSTNNSETLRDAVLESLGIALVPDFTALAAVQAGKLVVVLHDWCGTGAIAESRYI